MTIRRYLVGKAVRNRLLDLPEGPRDWVFTGADSLPQALGQSGFTPAPGDRVWLARRGRLEENTLRIEETPEAGIEDELALADLGIHALAMDENGHLIDPFGGEEQLQEGLLRHASPWFAHQPAHVLSLAVTGAELARWGFHVAHGTYGLLKRMARDGRLATLPRAHVVEAMDSALEMERPGEFFRILHRCGALAVLLPELDARFEDAPSHGKHHLPDPLARLDALETDKRKQVLAPWLQA